MFIADLKRKSKPEIKSMNTLYARRGIKNSFKVPNEKRKKTSQEKRKNQSNRQDDQEIAKVTTKRMFVMENSNVVRGDDVMRLVAKTS